MSENGLEIEAKFYISQLDHITARLDVLQARLIQPRVLEVNLRFDLPDGGLRAKGQVLRLRRDTETRLTFKSSSQEQSGVLARREIEFVVDDFEKARQFLEALGYREIIIYEKYRMTFELEGALIMLDELPYGNFLEIEGESVEQIQAVAAKLDLDWDAAIRTSYTALFSVAANSLQLPFRDITFSNFERISVTAEDLHVRVADPG
jgi:adenylate cyclase, class 2